MKSGFDVDAWIADARAKGLEVVEGPRMKCPLIEVVPKLTADETVRRKPRGAGKNITGPQTRIFNEVTLWCRAMGYSEPVANHRFHETRKWELDLAWPAHKIAVELQGGYYEGIGHANIDRAEGDFEKADEARRTGWIVKFFTYPGAKKGIFKWLEEEFQKIKTGHY